MKIRMLERAEQDLVAGFFMNPRDRYYQTAGEPWLKTGLGSGMIM